MKNSTFISLIMDRSGSIGSVLPQMQSAVTEFLNAQKVLEGECELLLAEFDDKYSIVYKGPIKDVPNYAIVPRSMTALHDAIGRTITEVGRELAARDESERPDKVMFVIITDGLENASTEFTGSSVRNLITHQTEKYNWNFDFLGANQDAILVGEDLGVLRGNSMSFCTSVAGTHSFSASLSAKTATFRDSGVYDFYSPSMRKEAMTTDEDEPKPLDLNKEANELLINSGLINGNLNPPAAIKNAKARVTKIKNKRNRSAKA